MGLSVRTDVLALAAQRHLAAGSRAIATSLERLSSGFRINRAADDAAGLAISEGLRAQLGGLAQAVRNTQDGISVVQTAEAALGSTASILQRMRDLAVQAENDGALDGTATTALRREVEQLQDELAQIAGTTGFDGTTLLDGTYQGTFQVGANAGDTVTVSIDRAMDAAGLGLDGLRVGSREVGTSSVPARERVPRLQEGQLVFAGAGGSTGGITAVTGDVSVGSAVLHLPLTSYDADGDGVVSSAAEAVQALNAAAAAAGITHRPDVFALGPGGDLVLRGAVPPADATPADLDALTPRLTGGGGAAVVPASTADPARAGLLLAGATAADLGELRGAVRANGKVLELGGIRYVDTDGSGAVSRAEALAQLNAAALHAGVTTRPDAFTEGPGGALWFTGEVPADDATAAEAAGLTPAYAGGPSPIAAIDDAIALVSAQRAALGAVQNRFEHTVARLRGAAEDAASAQSRIRDADMAQEATVFSSNQVRVQAGTAVLAQAHSSARQVLTLLGG